MIWAISFNLSGFFRNDVFPRPDFDQEERRWEIAAGMGYNIFNRLSLGINYIYRERNSNIDICDYKDNRLIFRLVLEH